MDSNNQNKQDNQGNSPEKVLKTGPGQSQNKDQTATRQDSQRPQQRQGTQVDQNNVSQQGGSGQSGQPSSGSFNQPTRNPGSTPVKPGQGDQRPGAPPDNTGFKNSDD